MTKSPYRTSDNALRFPSVLEGPRLERCHTIRKWMRALVPVRWIEWISGKVTRAFCGISLQECRPRIAGVEPADHQSSSSFFILPSGARVRAARKQYRGVSIRRNRMHGKGKKVGVHENQDGRGHYGKRPPLRIYHCSYPRKPLLPRRARASLIPQKDKVRAAPPRRGQTALRPRRQDNVVFTSIAQPHFSQSIASRGWL